MIDSEQIHLLIATKKYTGHKMATITILHLRVSRGPFIQLAMTSTQMKSLLKS